MNRSRLSALCIALVASLLVTAAGADDDENVTLPVPSEYTDSPDDAAYTNSPDDAAADEAADALLSGDESNSESEPVPEGVADPDAGAAREPGADTEAGADALAGQHEPSLRDQAAAYLAGERRWRITGWLAGSLVILMVLRMVLDGKPSRRQTLLGRIFLRRISPAWILLVLVGLLGYEVRTLRAAWFEDRLEDNMHFVTFHEFGDPPVPTRPPVKKGLAGTCYRGNETPDPDLWNGGHYRTGTFRVALCDLDGRELKPGDPVSGRNLFIKLELERAPFTPDSLYDPTAISRMFLTGQCEKFLGRSTPVADRVDLTEVEPKERWEARFPIGEPSGRLDEKRGVIYVCEEYHGLAHGWTTEESRLGSRFRYGIVYEVIAEGGDLSAESDLYMGAVYRPRTCPAWKVPMDHWFSHEPIPELPHEPGDALEQPGSQG